MSIIQELSKAISIAEVDFRVQSVNKGGYATILAYKDARVDMNRLDAVCGVNWQKDYKLIDGKLFCGIGIKVKDEWVWRWDVGVESNAEKEKGQASDSFKRAGFCWGIGRELYNYPLIQIKLHENELTEYQGKLRPSFNFKLREWKWYIELDEDGSIKRLAAKDQNDKLRYDYKKK